MKKTHLLALIALLLAGIGAWLWRHGRVSDTSTATLAAPKPTASSDAIPEDPAVQGLIVDEEREARLLLALAEEIKKASAVRWSAQRVADNYRRAATAEARRLALAEFQDWRFKREDAAAVLRVALRDTDVGVRVYAANLLYQMGLADGKEILLEVLRSVRSLAPQELMEAITAARILDRHREVVPPDLLIGLYEETGYPGVIGLMAAQGDKIYLPYLLEAARMQPNGTVHALGLLGAPEGYALAKQVFENTRNAEVKVMAAWALFRCKGDPVAFDYVLSQAAARLEPENRKDYDPYAAQAAMRIIAATPAEPIRPLLHQAVNASDSQMSGMALASLFYIQNDTVFVDQFVRNYLSDPIVRERSAVDPNLVWRIAAARNDPSLTALAYAANADRTKQLIIEGKDRPVMDVWIRLYLSDIPRR
jgi:hypothetical protein